MLGRSAAIAEGQGTGAMSAPPSERGSVVIDGVSMVFPARRGRERVVALEGVDLIAAPGEFISLVGPSGCGKSTLLKIIAGLVQPSTGRVAADGSVISGPRQSIGLMFQTPELFPWRSAIDNVLLPIDAQGLKRKAYVNRARSLLQLVGLADSEHAHPRELSGGMQQRVALSRTLIADPTILLMDEPFGSLDEFTRERLDLELETIWQRHRKTVFFVTHSIPEAVLLSERVVVFGSNPGRIIADHPVDLPRPRTIQLLKSPEFVAAAFAIRESMGIG